MADPNTDFTELAATTIAKYSPELADNVSDNIPLMAYMKAHDGIKEIDGGTSILENLMYGDNNTVKWYDGYELLDVTPSTIITAASFAWKQMNGNVIFSGKEEAINSGKEKQFDLIQSRIKNLEISCRNNMGGALFNAGTETSGKEIGGLQHIVPTVNTSGIVGNINRATTANAFWRNQVFDCSDNSITLSSSTIAEGLNRTHMLCTRGLDAPHLIVMGATHFGFFEAYYQDKMRFTSTDTKKGRLGFNAYVYKGADVIYDPNCTTTSTYMLNLDYLKLQVHRSRNFKVAKPKTPHGQDATVIPLYWMGNMTCSNASLQGIMNT